MNKQINPFVNYYMAQAGEGPWDFPVFEERLPREDMV